LIVQQISPHHKLCVYIILYRFVHKNWAGRLHDILWYLKVNKLYICKIMLLVQFDVLLVYTVYVLQSNKLLTTLTLIYDHCNSWRQPHLQRKIFPFGDVSCAALTVSDHLLNTVASLRVQATGYKLVFCFIIQRFNM